MSDHKRNVSNLLKTLAEMDPSARDRILELAEHVQELGDDELNTEKIRWWYENIDKEDVYQRLIHEAKWGRNLRKFFHKEPWKDPDFVKTVSPNEEIADLAAHLIKELKHISHGRVAKYLEILFSAQKAGIIDENTLRSLLKTAKARHDEKIQYSKKIRAKKDSLRYIQMAAMIARAIKEGRIGETIRVKRSIAFTVEMEMDPWDAVLEASEDHMLRKNVEKVLEGLGYIKRDRERGTQEARRRTSARRRKR